MTRTSKEQTSHFRIGVVSASVTTSLADLIEQYTSLYRDYLTDRPDRRAIRVHVAPTRFLPWHRRRFVVRVNDRVQFEPARIEEVLPYVDWAINWEVPRGMPEYLQLHASSMEVDGLGVIFPGESGSGKSTLTAGLLAGGWRYLCDEFALIHAETLELNPYPRAICIKRPAYPVIESIGLKLHGSRNYLKGSKGYVGFISPADVRTDAVGKACSIRYVIFPKYTPGAEPRLVAISRAEAAFAMHRVCFNLLDCKAVGLDVLAAMVRGASCYRLVSGEIQKTCDIVQRLVDGAYQPRATSVDLSAAGGPPPLEVGEPMKHPPRPRTSPGAARRSPSSDPPGSKDPGHPSTHLATWLRAHSASEIRIPPAPIAWERFSEAACQQGLAGLTLEAAAQHHIDVPEHVAAKLRHRATAIAANNLNQTHEAQRLLTAFNLAGVPVMLLKGAALNRTVYDRPDLRPMSDLDLLIRPATVESAFHVLEKCGYRRGFDLVRGDFFPTYHYEVEFLGSSAMPLRIDLHARPFRPLRISRTMPDDALWHDAITVHCGNAIALVPRSEPMFIHLAAHAAFHGCSRLLWLYDLKRLVDHYADGMDWTLVARSARDWRLSLPVLRAVTRASELLGPIAPPALIEQLQKDRTTWRDRLTLAQAPRDAASPAAHVLVNALCTPGFRFSAGYLLANLIPEGTHLADVYPFRHLGWTVCARVWRLIRALGRCAAEALQHVRTACSSSRVGGADRARVCDDR